MRTLVTNATRQASQGHEDARVQGGLLAAEQATRRSALRSATILIRVWATGGASPGTRDARRNGRADRPGGARDEHGCRAGRSRLAEHVRPQHVPLPVVTYGGRRFLRAQPPAGRRAGGSAHRHAGRRAVARRRSAAAARARGGRGGPGPGLAGRAPCRSPAGHAGYHPRQRGPGVLRPAGGALDADFSARTRRRSFSRSGAEGANRRHRRARLRADRVRCASGARRSSTLPGRYSCSPSCPLSRSDCAGRWTRWRRRSQLCCSSSLASSSSSVSGSCSRGSRRS
jgi:hypothetical protein